MPEPPDEAHEAVDADAGENVEYEAEPDEDEEVEPAEPAKTWFAFQVIDAAGKPVGGEKCKLKVKEDVTEPTTGGDGVVRVDEIDAPAAASIRLKDRYDYEWDFLEVADEPKAEE